MADPITTTNNASFNIPLFRFMTVFCGTDNTLWNIPSFRLNVGNSTGYC